MGRQFSYYCLAADLAKIQDHVFEEARAQLATCEKRLGADHIVPVSRFELAADRMGKDTLFLLLLPPVELQLEVFDGPFLDTVKSHLIEVGRCYTDGEFIRRGRFWYETRFYVDDQLYEKPREFVAWAEGIFRNTKKLLARHEFGLGGRRYADWIGQHALDAVRRGELELEK